VVVDPVMTATDGGDLGASARALARLVRAADLATPNRQEAAALSSLPIGPGSAEDVRRVVGSAGILLKQAPGALAGEVHDVLVTHAGTRTFRRARDLGPDPRGTGCALATAIACGLAGGASTIDAVAAAIAWLERARRSTRVGPDGRAHLVTASAG
jgi:hydroxymethylpyrimidine/phosphomethylpyrimidine kinase